MIQEVSDAYGAELTSEMVVHAFEKEYLLNINGYYLKSFNVLKRHFDKDEESSIAEIEAVVVKGVENIISATSNGPLDAF